MTFDGTSLETLVNDISQKTSVSPKMIYGNVDRAKMSGGWHDSERKALHEDYWGNLIFEEVQSSLSKGVTSFEELWEHINFHEFFKGSNRGKKIVNKSERWWNVQGLMNRSTNIMHRPAADFLFREEVEKVSPFVMNSMRRDRMLTLIRPYIQDDTAIIDLGSGWGRYSTLFARNFKGVDVFAGEISEAGRTTTQAISAYFSLGIKSFDFNYQSWNELIEVLKSLKDRHLVIFSNHSIEQVTYLNMSLFTDILSHCSDVQFVHVEPVGWQLTNERKSLDFSRPPKAKLGPNKGYNKNLAVILKQLSDDKKIKDLSAITNYLSFGNTRNSGTLLTYRGLE